MHNVRIFKLVFLFSTLAFFEMINSSWAGTPVNNNYFVTLKNQKVINFDELNLNQAIKYAKGDGSRKIAIFSEIECAYCKYLERDELSKLDNVTTYTFLFTNQPKKSLAWRQAQSIYCAENPAQAWKEFIFHDKLKVINVEGCESPLESNHRLAKRLGVQSTPTLFFTDGRRALGLIKAKAIEKKLVDMHFYGD